MAQSGLRKFLSGNHQRLVVRTPLILGTAIAVGATLLSLAAPAALGTVGSGEGSALDASWPVRTERSRGADPQTLLVKLRKPSPAAAALPRRVAGAAVSPILGRWVEVDSGSDPQTVREQLLKDPAVRLVSFNHDRQAHSDDPLFHRRQAYLRATMDFPQAWRRSAGSGVKVAVIDTGVDSSHPDLGRVLRGHDFVGGHRRAVDPNGHGTFVAGVIAARRGNQRGIAGASRATILPVRVLNARGFGRDSDVARGIRWSVKHQADIINLSLGGARPSRLLRDAVRYAERRDVLVVASAGNSGGTRPVYPAALHSVVAVGATDGKDRLAWFSQHGEWVDLVAPGWKIASTIPGNRYAVASGTSFSAPLVTAAAALVLAQHPRWSPARTRLALSAAAADAGPIGPDTYTGLGVVDADGALGGTAKSRAAGRIGLAAVMPSSARRLGRAAKATLNPEGGSVWYFHTRSSPRKVTFSVDPRGSDHGVLRGNVVLSVYDTQLRLIKRVDRWPGSRTERLTIRMDDRSYVEITNQRPTRLPGSFVLRTRSEPTTGAVTHGSGRRPLILDADPRANELEVATGNDLKVTLGPALRPASITPASVRLLDGLDAGRVSRSVSYDSVTGVLTVDPNHDLSARRDYSLVLTGLRGTSRQVLPTERIGFRTR